MRVAHWTVICLTAAAAVSGDRFLESAVAGQDRPTFSTRAQLVLLHVTVKDRRDGYIAGLDQRNFSIFDNDQPQEIRFFLDEDAPVTIGLLIDSSGSMQPNRPLVVAASSSFVETSNPRDEVFALAFNDDVRPALPPSAPFTNDAATLRGALSHAFTPQGRTALYDGIVKGLEYVNSGSHPRKMLVIVSDGADNASEATLDQVVPLLQASNVVVYAIGLTDPLEGSAHPARLKRLTDVTGGETFLPRNPSQVSNVLQQIARDIRHTYVVAYEPNDRADAEGLHRIRVTVTDERRSRFVVRTRGGYLKRKGE